MPADDTKVEDKRAGRTVLKREAITVVGSVIATLIATTLIDQFSNIQALLAQQFRTSVGTTFVVLLVIAFAAGAVSLLLVRRTRELVEEKAAARESGLRADLRAEMHALEAGKDEQIRRLTRELEELKRQSAIDLVTGVYNSNQIPRFLQPRIDQALSESRPFCLILVDIDGFKSINDTHGHEVGNRVLKQVAGILEPRDQEDVLCRYGGDEFLIITQLGTDVTGGFGFADRVRKAVEEKRFYAGSNEHLTTTISCGVTVFREGDDAGEMRARADRALNRAKAPRKTDDGVAEKNWVYVEEPG